MTERGDVRPMSGTVSIRGEVIADMSAFLARTRRARDRRGEEKESIGLCRTAKNKQAEHGQLHPKPDGTRKPGGESSKLGRKQIAGDKGDTNNIYKNKISRTSSNQKPVKPKEAGEDSAEVEETRRS